MKKAEIEAKREPQATLVDRLKMAGLTSAYVRRFRIELSEKEARALADLLEREKLVVESNGC